MPLKAAHLQALLSRRREAEHDRIERTEAVNKYFNHWGKVTARFENWTTPDYYKQAEQQLENTKQQKEKQKKLAERQAKLAQLLDMEKRNYEQELQEKQRKKNLRRSLDTQTLEKIDMNLKEQQQMRRKLELEAKLYGKWRHGVENENIIFESKSDHEVLAKLNWLDIQVDQQMQREKEEEAAKERQLKFQQEINKSEELHKERQEIREKEIHEIRCMQEYHLDQLKERQKETDDLKQKESKLKDNLSELEKELELLEESYAVLTQTVEFGDAYNFNKIKMFIRNRSQIYRNQIQLCLRILERILDLAEKPEIVKQFKKHLEQQMEKEAEKLTQLQGMYESEAKYSLQRSEELWRQEYTQRYKELKQILMNEHRAINTNLNELGKRHADLLEIRSNHLGIIENASEKLKLLIQEAENSSRLQTALPVDFSTRRNCCESPDNNMSPRCSDHNRLSNSFSHLNLDAWPNNHNHLSPRELETEKTTAQRSLQVVTAKTESERPRFGRKHVVWN